MLCTLKKLSFIKIFPHSASFILLVFDKLRIAPAFEMKWYKSIAMNTNYICLKFGDQGVGKWMSGTMYDLHMSSKSGSGTPGAPQQHHRPPACP